MGVETDLKLEYIKLSWDYEFPEVIECALEEDYVKNKALYNENTLKIIKFYLLVCPDIGADKILEIVRDNYGEHGK